MPSGYDTSLLDRAIDRRRASREQERLQVLTDVLRLLDEHGPRYGIHRAFVFGSITQPGQFYPESDVDIAVDSIETDAFFEALSELSLALERDVDLIELRKCHFAHRIRAEGIIWTRAPSRS